ncbi:MAG: ribbon-helix-helix protein, CopG family [Candidatus Rokubacteria bacterium]|nr:ribbon-helix-helix protein, CopG family [Candidatus Rokubacteria bacterium]
MGARKLVTISLPPALLKEADKVAKEENRTKSELLREALRFYVDTKEARRLAARERLLPLLDQVQARTKAAPAREIRKVVREAVRLCAVSGGARAHEGRR